MKFNISFDKVLNSTTKIKILERLFEVKSSMSEREISRLTKVSHMSVNRFMKQLAALNLIHFERIGDAHVWKLNKESFAYRELSKIVKDFSQVKSPLEDLKKTILESLQLEEVLRIVIYGSIALREEDSNSDVDLFILLTSNQDKGKLEPVLDRLSTQVLKLYGNRLSPYLLSVTELKRKRNLSLLSQIEKGIEIYSKKK